MTKLGKCNAIGCDARNEANFTTEGSINVMLDLGFS